MKEPDMSLAHGARRLPAVETAARTPPVVRFTFDGQDVDGFEGEPIAIALLAAGVRVFRTMPESGERRGGFCFTGRCADCLMIVDGQSGVRACVTPLSAGMTVQTQHGHGEMSQ
jgi:aerobic-type carbon monoxide dehydrogenase small subunit (CoxS/CutS family)